MEENDDEKLTIVQCLFCLNESDLQRMVQSLRSFVGLEAITAIYLDGWFATVELYDAYCAEIQRHNERNKIVIRRRGINCGKAFILHSILSALDAGFVLYMDCDLVLIQSPFVLQRLRELAINTVVFLDQRGDNRHHACVYQNAKQLQSSRGLSEIVCAPPLGIGIAGGAWIANTDVLRLCSYPMVGIYAPDDAIWVRKLMDQQILAVVCKTISVEHPHPQPQDATYVRHKNTYRRGQTNFDAAEYVAEIDAFHSAFGAK